MLRRIAPVVLVLFLCLPLTGCYLWEPVQMSQVGLHLPDGTTVGDVLGTGRYTDLGPFATLVTIDVSAKVIEWEDPDLVTRDKQPIGLTLAVTFARKRDRESVLKMWSSYRNEAVSDAALISLVMARIPRAAKATTARYSLDEMLGTVAGQEVAGREKVSMDLETLLRPQLEEVGIELLDIGISNISPDPQYLELLKAKARAKVEGEVSQQRTAQLAEQLKQEQAQTDIELEKARRQNEVNAELAKVYTQSPQYFELEKLSRLAQILGDKDKIFFVPQGMDLTMFFGMQGTPVAVTATDAGEQAP